MSTWILVADESRARLFSAEAGDGAMDELGALAHVEGRAHDREFTRDARPATQARAGLGAHGMQARTSEHDKHMQEFARALAELLEEGRDEHAYDKLVIVATPRLLGVLRDTLSDEVTRLLADSFAKNMTRCSPEQIRAVLQS
jgi:protein required for attachment to host cells